MNTLQAVLVLGFGVAIGACSRSDPGVQTLHELLLVDQSGRTRARLGITGKQPLLEMFDEAGRRRAAFGLLPEGNGASLELFDSTGAYPRVELRAEDPGQHGSVDFLTFRSDGASGQPSSGDVVRLGHGGFGTGAELVLGGGDDSIHLETFPNYPGATITLRGTEIRDSPSYTFYLGRLPRGDKGSHPTMQFAAGSQATELEIAPDRIVLRIRSGDQEIERTLSED